MALPRYLKKDNIRQPVHKTHQPFKRSRTLTGSISAEVKSVGEQRGILKSERLRRQELQRLRRIVFSGLLVIGGIISGIGYLIGQYTYSLPAIHTKDAAVIIPASSKQKYSQAIMNYLEAHPAERFRFATSEKNLTYEVQKRYPEIQSIKGSSDGYELRFRKPLVAWAFGQKNFFVDNEGVSFETNYYTPPNLTVTDKSGTISSSGNILIGKGFLSYIGRFVALTATSGLGEVTVATIPPGTTREVDVILQNRPYSVKLHTDRVPDHSVEDLKRVGDFLEKKGIVPQYIDVRVSGRAYYR
jgi:hypothetical protein